MLDKVAFLLSTFSRTVHPRKYVDLRRSQDEYITWAVPIHGKVSLVLCLQLGNN